MLESLFNKDAGLFHRETVICFALQWFLYETHFYMKCVPMNIAKFLKTPFFIERSL